MQNLKLISLLTIAFTLTACALTPQQKAEREAKKIKQAQALEIRLAKQCDPATADLIEQQYNPPLNRTAEQQKQFEQQYVEKVNNPVFQACYKLALENYKAQEQIRYLQMHYDDEYFGFGRLCRSCW